VFEAQGFYKLVVTGLDQNRMITELSRTYVVAVGEGCLQMVVHAVLLHRHEERVDDDTQRDEHVDERIHDKQLDDVSELVPAAAALPAEQQLVTLALQKLLLVHAFLEPEKI